MPGYNIQSLFRVLPQHTVALTCAKALELPQNGFLRGNQSSTDALNRARELYGQFLDVLEDINDTASAREAAPRIREIIEDFDRFTSQVSHIRAEDLINQAEWAGFAEGVTALARDMQRIAINPELAAALSEEFAEFEVSVPFDLETESRQKTDRTLIPGDESIPTDAVQNLNVVLRTSFSSLPSV